MTVSNYTPLQLVETTGLSNTAASYYVAPVQGAIISKAVFTNTSGSAVAVTAYLVKSGGSTGTGNIIISAQSISANSTYVSQELIGMVLEQGDALWAFAGTGSVVNLSVGGVIFS